MSLDVSIILRLVDMLTGPAKAAGNAFSRLNQSVKAANANLRSGGGMLAMSNNMQKATKSAVAYQKQMDKMAAANKRMQASNRGMMVAGGDPMKYLAGYLGVNAIMRETLEAAKADNKFKALVDSVDDNTMSGIRKQIQARMIKSGEDYNVLMDAAGDAAQILGSPKMAANVAIAASKLKNIDTAGKSVADFSENIAAIIKAGGTLEQLGQLGDMLTMQQKLGAATAGGSIEAYKQAAQMITNSKTKQEDALTAIGLIKNRTPALIDSQIGTNMAYGIRMMTMPNPADIKKLKAAGFKKKDFYTGDDFDLAKAQEALYNLKNSKGVKAGAIIPH